MPDPVGTMISSMSTVIVERLKTEGGFVDGDIELKSPATATSAAKVSMFLFRVDISAAARNNPVEVLDPLALRQPPLPLELTYLFTPLSTDASTALGHLETIMRVMYDHAVIKPPLLPTPLVDAGNEVIRITPYPMSLEDTNRLWSMFPNKPYAMSMCYLISTLRIPSTQEQPVKRVDEKITHVFDKNFNP